MGFNPKPVPPSLTLHAFHLLDTSSCVWEINEVEDRSGEGNSLESGGQRNLEHRSKH